MMKTKRRGARNQLGKKRISLRVLMTLNLCLVATLCMLIISLMAFRAMDLAEKNRFRAALQTYSEQINWQINQEFSAMIHLSQQMLPTGNIGFLVETFLTTIEPYDRMNAIKSVDVLLGMAVFAANRVELVTYFTQESEGYKQWLGNLRVKSDFSPLEQITLSKKSEIVFQAFHDAGNRFTHIPVLSIVRPVLFNDDEKRFVYIESKTDIIKSIEKITDEQKIPYALIQLDERNEVKYSLAADVKAGDIFPITLSKNDVPAFGRNKGYVWCCAGETFGFKNVLLLPETYYDFEMVQLTRDIVFAAMIALLIIILLSFLLWYQLYRPLQTMKEEMGRFGKGNMEVKRYRFTIREYDTLFNQFSEMQMQINHLLSDVYAKEKEKRRLELDKLYFQINPHFIMNALNSAQWQARLENQSALAEYLSHLNYILGYTLGKVSRNTTLRSEIKMLMEYLDLQKTRQDFVVHTDIQQGIYLDRPCARLILQPLAENAICHSIDDFGNLWISIHQESDNRVRIIIRDDGAGFDTALLTYAQMSQLDGERQTKNGIGLRYVWLSLQETYGESAIMEVESEPGKGTCVTIILPDQQKGEEKL